MATAVIFLWEVLMDLKDDRAEWVEYFERSGLTQLEFEKQHGLPGRTLRSWRRKVRAGRQPPAEAVRKVVEHALAALTAIRASLVEAERRACADEKSFDVASQAEEPAPSRPHTESPQAPTRGPSAPTVARPVLPPASAAEVRSARRPAADVTRAPTPSTATSAVIQPPPVGQQGWSTFGAGLNWG